MTEEQKVPPGILAFKRKFEIYTKEPLSDYSEWVSMLLNREGYTIHTISVDGKEWNVGEHTDKGTIISFRWKEDQWDAETKRSHYSTFHLITMLSKLPPNPSLNKEEELEKEILRLRGLLSVPAISRYHILQRENQELKNELASLKSQPSLTRETITDFIKWIQSERWHLISNGEWGHDYRTFSGFPVFTTTSQLLDNYLKTIK